MMRNEREARKRMMKKGEEEKDRERPEVGLQLLRRTDCSQPNYLRRNYVY